MNFKNYILILVISTLLLAYSFSFAVSNPFTDRPKGERYGLEFELGADEFSHLVEWFDYNFLQSKVSVELGYLELLISSFGPSYFDDYIQSEADLESLPKEWQIKLTEGLNIPGRNNLKMLNSLGEARPLLNQTPILLDSSGKKIENQPKLATLIHEPKALILKKSSIRNNSDNSDNFNKSDNYQNTELKNYALLAENADAKAKEFNFIKEVSHRWIYLPTATKFELVRWQNLKASKKAELLFVYLEKTHKTNLKANIDHLLIARDSKATHLNDKQREILQFLESASFAFEGGLIEAKYKNSYVVNDPERLYKDFLILANLSQNLKALTNPVQAINRGSWHYHISRSEEIPIKLMRLLQDRQLFLRLKLGFTGALDSKYGYSQEVEYRRGLVAYGNGEKKRLEVRQHILPLLEELKEYLYFLNLPSDEAIHQLTQLNSELIGNIKNLDWLGKKFITKINPEYAFDFIVRNDLLNIPSIKSELLKLAEVGTPFELRQSIFYEVIWIAALQGSETVDSQILADMITNMPNVGRKFGEFNSWVNEIPKEFKPISIEQKDEAKIFELIKKKTTGSPRLNSLLSILVYNKLDRSEKFETITRLENQLAFGSWFDEQLIYRLMTDSDPLIVRAACLGLLHKADMKISNFQIEGIQQMVKYLTKNNLNDLVQDSVLNMIQKSEFRELFSFLGFHLLDKDSNTEARVFQDSEKLLRLIDVTSDPIVGKSLVFLYRILYSNKLSGTAKLLEIYSTKSQVKSDWLAEALNSIFSQDIEEDEQYHPHLEYWSYSGNPKALFGYILLQLAPSSKNQDIFGSLSGAIRLYWPDPNEISILRKAVKRSANRNEHQNIIDKLFGSEVTNHSCQLIL